MSGHEALRWSVSLVFLFVGSVHSCASVRWCLRQALPPQTIVANICGKIFESQVCKYS